MIFEKANRELVLKFFYDRRDDGVLKLGESSCEEILPEIFFRTCAHLAEDGFISFRPIRDGMKVRWGTGEIKSKGIKAYLSGQDLMSSTVMQNVTAINSPGANFNFGNGSIHQEISWTQTVDQKIDHANATAEEKQKAKSILAQISENKLINTIIGAAVGELTKAALPE